MSQPARLFDPGEPEPRRGSVTESPTKLGPGDRVVRVLPDVSGLDREFDYIVPAELAADIDVGTMVRVELQGRRVAAWITDVDVEVNPSFQLQPIIKVSSVGPSAEEIDLARWAATRWRGRLAAVVKTASPPRMVRAWPRRRSASASSRAAATASVDELVVDALAKPEVTAIRCGPADDQVRFAAGAAAIGDALIVVPSVERARWMSGRLHRLGHRTHLQPGGWSGGPSGGVVIGPRSAVWAPTGTLGSIVVLDEHDEALQEERVPMWHARDVAIERARRAGVPCLLVSPAPSLAGLAAADRTVSVSRTEERASWPAVEVIDQREAEPGRGGLFSPRVVELLREDRPAVAVLNRKGRARMLACNSCGELVRTEDGEHLMVEVDDRLVAPATGESRPLVCAVCAGTGLKRLRLGVTRATEEMAQLVRRPVIEVTSDRSADDDGDLSRLNPRPILLGTEAALHAAAGLAAPVETVVFLDFDQELHAPRYRAAEQAMWLLTRAARLLGGRRPEARIVIQTRSPEHRVVRSALLADPSRLVADELAMRNVLGFPPAGALAEVGGAGAAEFVASVPPEVASLVTILGPRSDGRFLLRADGQDQLSQVLAAIPRPAGRVRVGVDPPRV